MSFRMTPPNTDQSLADYLEHGAREVDRSEPALRQSYYPAADIQGPLEWWQVIELATVRELSRMRIHSTRDAAEHYSRLLAELRAQSEETV